MNYRLWMCDNKNAPAPNTGDLLVCPWCGETPVAEWYHNARFGTSVSCQNGDCALSPGVVAPTPKLAAAHWNTRYYTQRPPASKRKALR